MAKAMTPEEKQEIVDMFNSLPVDMENRYEVVAKHFKKATTTCFRVVKKAQTQDSEIKYFDHKTFPY